MKVISSKSVKNTIQYTWWAYLLTPVLLAPLFYWSFTIYHKPSAFEKVAIFVGASVTDSSFTDKVKDKVESDSLRTISLSICTPDTARYEEKLSVVGLNNCDLLILPTSSFTLFEEDKLSNYFLPLDSELEAYSTGSYYESGSTKYGYDVTSSWLKETYLDFKEGENYYLLYNAASKNIGKYREEGNTNENALKVAKAILEGI